MFSIGHFKIGSGRTFIVAEIGSNHAQSLSLAKEHILAAKEAGADAVKFQSIMLDKLYYKPDPKTRELIKSIELPEEWYEELKTFCDKEKIVFFSTPTYLDAVDKLEEIGVPLYKIASPQVAVFPQLVEKVAKTQKPVFISLGQVGLSETCQIIEIFRKVGNERLVLLHCNSLYPTPYERVNLKYMQTLAQIFEYPVGFSDHTIGIYVSVAAVALGAVVIEKHFIINKQFNTPDALVSLTPKEFAQMVDGIRTIEKVIQEKLRLEPEDEEKALANSMIYRLILRKDKESGDSFYPGDFDYLRSPDGIDARQEFLVMSHFQAKKSLVKGQVLRWKDLEGK